MMYLRIFGAICVVIGVFLFGMWLTWPDVLYNPSGFPIGRTFVAVSLNDEPLIRRDMRKLATFEVHGRLTFKHRTGGTSLCGGTWGGPVTFLPGKRISWAREPTFSVGATLCASPLLQELEGKYLPALFSAMRWRREEDNLILENGRDVLRFQLAPP